MKPSLRVTPTSSEDAWSNARVRWKPVLMSPTLSMPAPIASSAQRRAAARNWRRQPGRQNRCARPPVRRDRNARSHQTQARSPTTFRLIVAPTVARPLSSQVCRSTHERSSTAVLTQPPGRIGNLVPAVSPASPAQARFHVQDHRTRQRTRGLRIAASSTPACRRSARFSAASHETANTVSAAYLGSRLLRSVHSATPTARSAAGRTAASTAGREIPFFGMR